MAFTPFSMTFGVLPFPLGLPSASSAAAPIALHYYEIVTNKLVTFLAMRSGGKMGDKRLAHRFAVWRSMLLSEYLRRLQAFTIAALKRGVWDIKLSSPLFHALDLSVEGKADRLSQIIVLLIGRRPTTISGFVISIVIDAINRHVGRCDAHIAQEVRKVLPTLAYADSSTAIVGIAGRRWNLTSRSHASPYPISARSNHAVLKPTWHLINPLCVEAF